MLVDAPHAGIIELGARPHPVSREGVEAIARWVFLKLHAVQGPSKKTFDEKSGKFRTTVPKDRRKQISVRREGPVREVNGKRKGPGSYKVGYDEASLQIAYAIAQKIKREGQKPKYVVKRHLPLASQYVAEECERLLRGAS